MSFTLSARLMSLWCHAAFCSKHVFVNTIFGESMSCFSRAKCVIIWILYLFTLGITYTFHTRIYLELS